MDVNEFVKRFKKGLRESWLQLAKKERELQEAIRPLKEERDEIRRTLDDLARLLDTLGISRDELSQELEQQPEIMMATAKRVNVADMAYAMLRSLGKPSHYKVILEAMREQGFNVPGKDPVANLLAHMLNDKKRFAKAKEEGRGYYKLTEWDST